MIKSIRLQNFRGFEDHTLPLRQKTVIVGANNAGKSTAVEALRLVSLVANRYGQLNYSAPLPQAELPISYRVVSPSLRNIDINFDNLFHLLGNPPAVITAEFTGGETIDIHLVGEERLYAVIKDSLGRVVKSKSEANQMSLGEVHILPQVAPLTRDERVLNRDYVLANMFSPLAPMHFRNQLCLMPEVYSEFCLLARETWPGLRIRELVGAGGPPHTALGLLVEDGSFVAEVSWMGHGLQMWLQTVWFVARTPKNATVILDEPDVYLHPDLQRRLIRLIRQKYSQVIVATHSVEIMSEVDPSEVLVIDRNRRESQFADNHPTVQRLIDHIGSSHNISLARLRIAKRFLVVEGDDLDLMNHIHSLVCPNSANPLASTPHVPVGGWGGWNYAIGSTMALQNYAGEQLVVYCIFDPDYHTPNQIAERYAAGHKRGLQLHIWARKEIENYLLVPGAISRLIARRLSPTARPPTDEDISLQIDKIADELKEEIVEALGNEFLAEDRRGGFPAAKRNAERLVNTAWQSREGRWSVVPGKEVLSKLSQWAHVTYGVSFGPMAVLRELREPEVPREMVSVIRAIHNGRSFPLIAPH